MKPFSGFHLHEEYLTLSRCSLKDLQSLVLGNCESYPPVLYHLLPVIPHFFLFFKHQLFPRGTFRFVPSTRNVRHPRLCKADPFSSFKFQLSNHLLREAVSDHTGILFPVNLLVSPLPSLQTGSHLLYFPHQELP